MIRILLTFLIPSLSFAQPFFENANLFLLENVDGGKINYKTLKENSQKLEDLINSISTFEIREQNDLKTAFYINTYNLLVIKQILDNYPIDSPMDIDGFFNARKFLVAKESLTLDEIEFDKLIGPTKDPRIHFALGCGAQSCPSLYDMAYTPQHLQEQLDFRAQLIIDQVNYVHVDKAKKLVILNKIFDWYGEQFVFSGGSLINYINKYRFYDVPIEYQIKFQEYDWSLNSKQ